MCKKNPRCVWETKTTLESSLPLLSIFFTVQIFISRFIAIYLTFVVLMTILLATIYAKNVFLVWMNIMIKCLNSYVCSLCFDLIIQLFKLIWHQCKNRCWGESKIPLVNVSKLYELKSLLFILMRTEACNSQSNTWQMYSFKIVFTQLTKLSNFLAIITQQKTFVHWVIGDWMVSKGKK